jgi:hypothetical protein
MLAQVRRGFNSPSRNLHRVRASQQKMQPFVFIEFYFLGRTHRLWPDACARCACPSRRQ